MSWPPTHNSMNLSGPWSIGRDDPAATGAPMSSKRSSSKIKWKPTIVPGAWQHVLGQDFHGIAWYRRSITVPTAFRAAHQHDRRLWLRFESVATRLDAWVNDRKVGMHVGDDIPFQFDITDALADSNEIDIALRVDEIFAPRLASEQEGALQNGHITKGFHDVISLQHAGIWQAVHLAVTGSTVAIPDGLAIRTDPATGRIALDIELESPHPEHSSLALVIHDPSGRQLSTEPITIEATPAGLRAQCTVASPARWSPDNPALYTACITLLDKTQLSEVHELRFGFRAITARDRTICFNDQPIMIRGVLDWGHEPTHIAPAPTPDEIRSRLHRLMEMGFNCVCLCMWYPPRCFFDIADEMGMLIWQEHPVWQSPMRDEDVDEYKRLFTAFLRRDRNHPCKAIVSAACEHPSFHPQLAQWWWNRAKTELPGTLLELQTAFFKWADLEKTDLYDEHTYDNSNRWVSYIDDVHAHLKSLPPKPFVMGETITFTAWPDINAIADRIGKTRPWWLPCALDHMRRLENEWRVSYGCAIVERFRKQSVRFCLLGRQFQFEQFRRLEGNAGLVMNHLRDVPQCQCGFMDDGDRWRFDPDSTRAWLGDAALLLWTPDHRRAFAQSESAPLPCRMALSNFAPAHFEGDIDITIESRAENVEHLALQLACPRGQVLSAPFSLNLRSSNLPARIQVSARAQCAATNKWDLWLFPDVDFEFGQSVRRLDALPFAHADAQPDDVEKGYSRGYGLPVRNWQIAMPDPNLLAPQLTRWDGRSPLPASVRVVLTHRLTHDIIDWMHDGGRVILLASKAPGGLGTSYQWLFGQAPLIIEEGPLSTGDSDWIIDLLGYDLTRRYARVIPVQNLGITDYVDPLIRLVYTHDQQRVKLFEMLFQTRVGNGQLMVSSLDHSEAPGRYLLHRMIQDTQHGTSPIKTSISLTRLREFAFDGHWP